jgi:hypothetical protein
MRPKTKGFKAEEVIAKLDTAAPGPKSYATLQCGPGPNDHIELNSDLLYGIDGIMILGSPKKTYQSNSQPFL